MTESTYTEAVARAIADTGAEPTRTAAAPGALHAPEDCADQWECDQPQCQQAAEDRAWTAQAEAVAGELYGAMDGAADRITTAVARLAELADEMAHGDIWETAERADILAHLAEAGRAVRAARAVLATRIDRPEATA